MSLNYDLNSDIVILIDGTLYIVTRSRHNAVVRAVEAAGIVTADLVQDLINGLYEYTTGYQANQSAIEDDAVAEYLQTAEKA